MKDRQTKGKVRSRTGGVLVGGTVLMVLLSMLGTGLLLLLTHIAVLGNNNERFQSVACEIAERAASHDYFFGVGREHDYNSIGPDNTGLQELFDVDKEYLLSEMEVLGINRAQVANVEIKCAGDASVRIADASPRLGNQIDVPIKLYTVSFDVLAGGVLPLHVVGTSSNYSQMAEQRHGSALISVVMPDPDFPDRVIQRGIRVPIYNVTYGKSMNADPNPEQLHMGPMVGQPPIAYLRLQCENELYINQVRGGPDAL